MAISQKTNDWDFSLLEDDTANTTESGRLTVVADTREQKPYEFEHFEVDVESDTLSTGDYSLRGYESQFAVERKSRSDFLQSITWSRDPFLAEIKRADEFEYPMAIVVEAPWEYYMGGSYARDVPPNVIRGTRRGWECFNIEWYFEADRVSAERRTYELLIDWERRFNDR